MQYVGETVQKFNEQVNWNKNGFEHLSNCGHCPVLSNQFDKWICKWTSFKVLLIDKIEGNAWN